MAWRLAESLKVLRDEVNARAPHRSKVSDGTLGDQAHASRASDHNPNSHGVVCAVDITDDPANGHDDRMFAEHIRKLGATGFPPLQDGGYVIANGQVAGGSKGWTWRRYTGVNAHAKHTHISANHRPDYDSKAAWGWHPSGLVVPVPISASPLEEDLMFIGRAGGKWWLYLPHGKKVLLTDAERDRYTKEGVRNLGDVPNAVYEAFVQVG